MRLLNLCFADSGVPPSWQARGSESGVFRLSLPDRQAVEEVHSALSGSENAPTVVSVYWGYRIAEAQRSFARALLEGPEVGLVFGHSAHHPREIQLHAGKAVVYGAGDLINDYEGIRGHEQYRPELALIYIVELARGSVQRLEADPFRRRRLRLERADHDTARHLQTVVNGAPNGKTGSGPFAVGSDGRLRADICG